MVMLRNIIGIPVSEIQSACSRADGFSQAYSLDSHLQRSGDGSLPRQETGDRYQLRRRIGRADSDFGCPIRPVPEVAVTVRGDDEEGQATPLTFGRF